jgi:FkbH-like protein
MRAGNVTVVRSTEPLTSDPALDYYDRHGYELGHMPYTREGYAAIATALVRKLFNVHGNPYKVIVLDCDNTLWRGVCGEEGWFGVEMTAPYRALQEFMVEQMKAGMLLCLCSRNNESDVLEVFDRRSDMPLKREHFAAWRINWGAKSANIRSLASELNLGLDSFIFVDDNPLDCADVKAHCPDVLALQLPSDPEWIPRFLAHVWAFDHAASTDEDRDRTRMYRESARREQYREQAFSLKEFIAGLELKLTLSEAKSAQFARLAQLTLRTNQFNFTGVRRTEAEIRHFVERENARCLAAQVTDRFGDYGLVAVLMYEIGEDRYTVDTFLASCRVLNRGIEHEVLARLGQRALADGKTWVEVPYIPTGKNAPAKAFIDSIGSGYGNGSGERWVFPASYLATLRYDPAAAGALSPPSEESSALAATARGSPRLFGSSNVGRALQAIGERWHDVDSIMSALDIGRSDEGAAEPNAAAGSEAGLEAQLARIWRTVLGKSHIGVHENFFEVGGTSLRAVQVVALIKKELGCSLSVLSVFESPTIALLSARLDSPPVSTDTPAGFAGAALRGQQRRNRALSPRHS